MKESSEIPISVLLPPDELTLEEENAWLKQAAEDPSLEITGGVTISDHLLRSINSSYWHFMNSSRNAEGWKINAIKNAKKWDRIAQEEMDPSSYSDASDNKKRYENEAAREARSAKVSRKSASLMLEFFRGMIERAVLEKRQDQWGDPDMPDLGLDFEAYETMPDEAIITWAKSLGIEIDKALG